MDFEGSLPSSQNARFEVFTAVKILVEVFRVVTPCSAAVEYQCFGGNGRSSETTQHYMASQLNLDRNFTSHFSSIHFNIILLSMPKSPKKSLMPLKQYTV